MEWISVEDRLPDQDGRYLICDKFGNINMRRYTKCSNYPFDIGPDHKQYFMPTHWAELPEPPSLRANINK